MAKTESAAAVLLHNQKIYSIQELGNAVEKKLTKIDKLIISARGEGLSFYQLEESDMKIVAAEIIKEGRNITGCEIPSTDNAMDSLCDSICYFLLNFGYNELTEKELSLALYVNARGGVKNPTGLEIDQVVFTGKTFNVDYLAKILANYLMMRNNLDRKFQNALDGQA